MLSAEEEQESFHTCWIYLRWEPTSVSGAVSAAGSEKSVVIAIWHLPSARLRVPKFPSHLFCCKQCSLYTEASQGLDTAFRTFSALPIQTFPQVGRRYNRMGVHRPWKHLALVMETKRGKGANVNRSGSLNSFLTPLCRLNSLCCRLSGTISLYMTQQNLITVSPQPALKPCGVAACAETIIPKKTQNYATTALLRVSAGIRRVSLPWVQQ